MSVRPLVSFHGAMRRGQSGAGFLSPLSVAFRVEQRCGAKQVLGHWVDQWVLVGAHHAHNEFAQQAAENLRLQGFTVRVRPVVV